MKGTIFIHLGKEYKAKPDAKWLFLLQKKLGSLSIQVVITEREDVTVQDVYNLQQQFDIHESQSFVAQHNPGNLSIGRFIEKIISSGLSKALLVAGRQKGIAKVGIFKELPSAKSKKIETNFKTLVATVDPAVTIVWIRSEDLLEEQPRTLLETKYVSKKKILSKPSKHGEMIWRKRS